MPGSLLVTNFIALRQTATPSDLKQRIKDVFGDGSEASMRESPLQRWTLLWQAQLVRQAR
jgi:hypothetical protein